MNDFINFLSEQWILSMLFITAVSTWYFFEKKQGAKKVSSQEAIFISNNQNGIFIDIRDENSHKNKQIPNSVNISSRLEGFDKKIEAHKDKKIILVCDNGISVLSVAKSLKAKKYDCVVLKGGINGWEAENFPITTKKEKKKEKKKKKISE
jgi:rhodanese-related sulfurtransferase